MTGVRKGIGVGRSFKVGDQEWSSGGRAHSGVQRKKNPCGGLRAKHRRSQHILWKYTILSPVQEWHVDICIHCLQRVQCQMEEKSIWRQKSGTASDN